LSKHIKNWNKLAKCEVYALKISGRVDIDRRKFFQKNDRKTTTSIKLLRKLFFNSQRHSTNWITQLSVKSLRHRVKIFRSNKLS